MRESANEVVRPFILICKTEEAIVVSDPDLYEVRGFLGFIRLIRQF